MKSSIRKRNEKREGLKRLLPLLLLALFAGLAQNITAKEKHSDAETAADSLLNARYVFEKLQCSALEILPSSIRLDMLDYWDVDSVYKASNVMGGLSWINTLTDNYAKVTITPVSSIEIKILPTKKGKIVMTVYTVGDDVQAADSQINFYDPQLRQLETKNYFEMPPLKDFFDIPKGSATKMKEIEEMIPFPTIAYSASDKNDNLTARLTVEQYVNQDDWNIAKLFVKPYITLEWKKDKFKYQ